MGGLVGWLLLNGALAGFSPFASFPPFPSSSLIYSLSSLPGSLYAAGWGGVRGDGGLGEREGKGGELVGASFKGAG